jgi:hypothetical protein
MRPKKKTIVMVALIAFMFIGIAASRPPEGFKNLKVLPKHISEQQLDKLMDEFKVALGVRCDFCHVRSKDDPKQWDFASDEKPEKDVARKMITMSNKINKKFFRASSKYGEEDATLEIRCVTCHHGSPQPNMEEQEGEKKEEKGNQ